MESDEKVYNPNLFMRLTYLVFEKPVIWFREKIVEPNRKEYYWYHEKRRRVPTIDECYTDDTLCRFEADFQWAIDKKVDVEILKILHRRLRNCMNENWYNKSKCNEIRDYFSNQKTNFFIKYGELKFTDGAYECYMKQKHRMAWERRHGPVGTGKKPLEERRSRQAQEEEEE